MRGQGVECHVFNLSLGDWFLNIGLGAKNYVGKVRNWRSYLDGYVKDHCITDIVYYADQRPYHRIARAIARQYNLNVYAYEFGYLRPDWITLERSGMGVFSHFPNDPALIRELASKIDQERPGGYYPYTFFSEAYHEVFYHLVPKFLPFLYPHYRHDRYYNPFVDYLSFIPRLIASKARARRATMLIDALLEDESPYFVVIMQLQSDYQIRRSSHYTHLSQMISEIVKSYADHAPENAKLIFKLHPYDNNFERWPDVVQRTAEELGCGERVRTIDGGDLGRLYSKCKGVVLINSTAGLHALQQSVPVKTLGIAIYDVAEITFQGSLDAFWTEAAPPDKETLNAFLKLLVASVQVKGNFFTREGRAVAVPEFARRIIAGDVNNYGAFVEPPPRLQKARDMGVPIKYED